MKNTRGEKGGRLLRLVLALVILAGTMLFAMESNFSSTLAANISLANLGSANKNDIVHIDNKDWVVVKTQDYQGQRYVYLIMTGYIYDNLKFNASTVNTDYNASDLRARMETVLKSYFPTIQAIAIKPNLGSHSSTSAKTSIFYDGWNVAMAGSATQDILFAPSIADMHEWIGAPGGSVGGSNWWVIPSGHPLNWGYSPALFTQRLYCRTSRNSAEVYGILRSANSMDGGIHVYSGYATDAVCVWVNAGAVNRTVTVKYVDTNGNPIPPGGPTSKPYNVMVGNTFTDATLTSSEVPGIPKYIYKGWQKNGWNAPTAGLPTGSNGVILNAQEVINGTDIYLVYEELERYLVSKDSNPSVILSTWHWLADAVDACGTDGPYTITATENDTDMADTLGTDPKSPINPNYRDVEVIIPADKTITLTSDTGNHWTITQKSNNDHLRVRGSLTIKNIILDGNNPTGSATGGGGINVSENGSGGGGALIINSGTVIQNCYSTASGGGVSANVGTVTMNAGKIWHNTAKVSGGGVAIYGANFTMLGGEISENTTITNGGGGMMINNAIGTITMEGGKIIDNTGGTGAGGVYIAAGTMILNNGEISGNTAATTNGGGVYVFPGSSFTMNGGKITGNETVNGDGGGVYVREAAMFTMTGGEITGNRAPKGDGGGIYTMDYDYSNPASTAKYMNIAIANATISGNTASAAHIPPKNAAAFTARASKPFNGALLDNDNINYHNPATTLTITKTVEGRYSDKTKKFGFTVTFTDASGSPLPSGPFSDPVTFSLKDGESYIIEDVPLSYKVQIEEAEDANYSVTFVDSETPGAPEDGRTTGDPREMTDDRIFAFTNTRVTPPETGIDLGDTGTMLLLALLFAAPALAYLAAKRLRRRRRGGR